MRNKKIIILSISLVVAIISAGTLGICLWIANNNYNDLYTEYLELSNRFNDLSDQYFILTGERVKLEYDYDNLLDSYNTLQDSYNTLQDSYNAICLMIKQSILPVQYSIFAEGVRRYYKDIYIGGLSGKLYWKAFATFCRDIVLHDSDQYNAFSEVSDAFSDALKYGSNTMYLSWYIMYYTFDPWLPYWNTIMVPELWGIDTVVDWCIDEIDYEYDSDITTGQEYFNWDYIKFPVETAFRTMGDCEDQAILTATYLESCGFETAIGIFHDPAHPTLGAFYHGVPLVHIEDTSAFWSEYPSCGLWRLGSGDPYYPDYTWCFLDTTWDVPFGSTPSWLQDYIDIGSISYNIHSIAFCDIDGNIQENLGLTYVIPI